MAKIGDRITSWTNEKRKDWGEPLGNFIGGIFEGVGGRYVERHEGDILDTIHDTIAQVSDGLPADSPVKGVVDRLNGKKSGWMIIAGLVLLPFILIPMLTAVLQPTGKLLTYFQDRLQHTYRRDPMSVIQAWRRDPAKYERLFSDLKDQGWSDDAIETLKFVTQFMPSAQDLVNWQAKEVFEPAMITKYGLDDEFAGLDLSLFAKIGVTEEQALNYWRAHWEHASWLQVVDMLRRGQLTEKDIWDWFRLVEIPPYWRDKLMAVSWEVPTRVDVRRFWEMRTIDEARLREIYTALGYHGKDLDDYVLWTKIYVDFPDLMTRYKNGWLTLDEVRAELVKIGMSKDRAEELIQTKVKAVASEKTVTEKDVTKAEIVKGVKQGVITRTQGGELLVDMGYSTDEAIYILAINIPDDQVDSVVEYRQLTKSEILSGLKAELIDREQARVRLLELRYSAEGAEYILKLYDAQVKPPEEPKLKEASKADIVLGVKKGLITQEEGYLMLIELGFSTDASNFILMVQTEESPFSPKSYEEFKDLTGMLRRSAGMEEKPMSEELKAAAAEVVKLTKDVEALRESVKAEEAKLIPEGTLPEAATKKLKALQVKLHRAEAELARVKSEYDRLVAEWRHST